MFRTVVVNFGERLSVKDNWLIISTAEGEKQIPIEDIYSVVVDNQRTYMSIPCLNALTSSGAHLLLCDGKHNPVSVVLPLNTHYRPLNVIKKQLSLTQDFKDNIWDRIVKHKVLNQAKVLELCGCNSEYAARLRELAEEVVDGDSGNREGIAAKMYFRCLFGSNFIRMNDDATNAALNYGYAVIRSSISKALCGYGFNCVLGIHHINESNPFNLADDLMEPFRPIIDLWVADNFEELLNELTRQQRNELAAIVNNVVEFGGKKMRIRNAVEKYIQSFSTAVERNNAKYILFPKIIRQDLYFEE
ncbi:MAG TPA: type II CRISPR-associated endonuclease Cas1 [Clostridiales bacterium]|nr:type II CRISPR-associated endonuclease Cas1 [Clostridiales bacterium]